MPRRIATVIGSEQIASQNRTLGGLPLSVNGVVSGSPRKRSTDYRRSACITGNEVRKQAVTAKRREWMRRTVRTEHLEV